MKTIVFFISILLSFLRVTAQQTAFFETTIYVEDAIGNIDSVVIGHDPEANSIYNPQFGELKIESPFDSVFEVRAAHSLDFSPNPGFTLSKKIISHLELVFYEADSCYLYPEFTVLVIHALHQPVTVRWDKNVFEESFCRRGSMITSHIVHLSVPDWWMEFDTIALDYTACMAETDHYTAFLFDYENWGFFTTHEVAGMGIDTIYAMMINPMFSGNIHSPCMGSVGVIENPIVPIPDVFLYPNPVTDMVYLDAGSNTVESFRLYDFSGKLLFSENTSGIDMSALSPGVYIALILISGGSHSMHKIVKQR